MGNYFIKPLPHQGMLCGEITVPSSKSHTLRAILFATMASGTSTIHRYLPSSDTFAMIEACKLFGAKITVLAEQLVIEGVSGKITVTEDVINAGNSGIVLRFCSAIGALGSSTVVITGDHSIRHQRPMQAQLQAMKELGVWVDSMRGDGFAPIIVKGPLLGQQKATISGEDSQPVSALLIASAYAPGPTELHVVNPGEKAWVNLTLDWFCRLNIQYEQKDFQYYKIAGNSTHAGFEYTVPGDFSSAAFAIAAAIITKSELILNNLDMSDVQGDKQLISVLISMGAKIDYDESKRQLKIHKTQSLQGKKIDINDFIDSITILAVIACFAEGETTIYNAAIAKNKECNRLHCIYSELKKMGADIRESSDGLVIRKSKLNGCKLQSYHDHRMVMSLAVAALAASGDSQIVDVECVKKTYPNFREDFSAIGATIVSNILLCGAPACGKSAIGDLLAKKLHYQFLDCDRLVEDVYAARHGEKFSCKEIFNKKGEAFFRQLEEECIASLAPQKNSVIATGGGAFASGANVAALKKLGTVIYLKTSPAECFARICKRDRILPAYLHSQGEDANREFINLVEKRGPGYEESADLILDNIDHLDLDAIVDLCLRRLDHGR
ncbi:MAG: 3-phosphoshikimate 1-carboxyvinyltransferase [Oligoflexia bacterium]|nr:3-phosphoshikimate 1-carboxyvinyltransferase [Oligoflexia bacterium]